MPKTANYSTRRAQELAMKVAQPTQAARTVVTTDPRRLCSDVVRFHFGEKCWRLPRIQQVLDNPEKYAAIAGVRVGPELDAYIQRWRERSPEPNQHMASHLTGRTAENE